MNREYPRGTKQETSRGGAFQAPADGNLVYQDDAHQTYLFFSPSDAQQAMNGQMASEFGGLGARSGHDQGQKTLRFTDSSGVQEDTREEFSKVSHWNQESRTDNRRQEVLLEEIKSHLQAIEGTLGRLEALLIQRQASPYERLVQFLRVNARASGSSDDPPKGHLPHNQRHSFTVGRKGADPPPAE